MLNNSRRNYNYLFRNSQYWVNQRTMHQRLNANQVHNLLQSVPLAIASKVKRRGRYNTNKKQPKLNYFTNLKDKSGEMMKNPDIIMMIVNPLGPC